MVGRQSERLTDAALHAFFDGLFPDAFAGADVLTEIAPKGWEQNLMLACFNPPIEQRYHEPVQLLATSKRSKIACRRDSSTQCDDTRSSQLTLQFWIARSTRFSPVSSKLHESEVSTGRSSPMRNTSAWWTRSSTDDRKISQSLL
jgi:hypothetical protein